MVRQLSEHGFLTQHFRRTETVVISLAVRPMRLRIVVGHKAFMGELDSRPSRYLLEVHLTHAPHHAKMRLNEIFPALTTVNILLLDLQGFTNSQELFCPKHSAIISDEFLWRSKPLDRGIEHNQIKTQERSWL